MTIDSSIGCRGDSGEKGAIGKVRGVKNELTIPFSFSEFIKGGPLHHVDKKTGKIVVIGKIIAGIIRLQTASLIPLIGLLYPGVFSTSNQTMNQDGTYFLCQSTAYYAIVSTFLI